MKTEEREHAVGFWAGVVIGFWAGGTIGVLVMAVLAAAKRGDRMTEAAMQNERKE